MSVDNFEIHSGYPTDKIVWIHEGQATTDQYGAWSVTISHGLNAVPFCTGIWTVDNWATQYNSSTAIHQGQIYSRFSQLSSNGTNIIFSGYATNSSGSPLAGATVKFRLWGFFNEASTLATRANETATVSDNIFVKNTAFGYPKLFMEGYADATSHTVTVNHNLGFIPFVEIWQQLDGRWWQVDYIDFSTSGTTWTIRNTSSKIEFNGEGYTNYNYYYRIYADV